MLKKIQILNYGADYDFAPPAVESLIDTGDISSIMPVETRRMEPCVKIRMKNGDTHYALGAPCDFDEQPVPVLRTKQPIVVR